MAHRERCRGLLALLLLVAKSWAQTSPPVVPVTPLGSAAPTQQVQGDTAAGIAMAESAAVAMANITGVPTAAPVQALSVTPFVGAAGTTFQPPTPAAGVQECKVLAGGVAKLMQVLLFVCSCAALIFKYRRESGDRTASEFLMDSSKQLIGAGWIHVLNIGFSKGLEAHFQAGDECHWYWLNIMLDCTLGVAVEYVLMMFLTSCIQKTCPTQAEDFETGDYRRQDGSCQPIKYVKQLLMWLLIVSLMKLCMCAIMALGHNGLMGVAQAMLSPFASDATLKLFVVMISTPVCMNVFQFWMVDNFIKRKPSKTGDMSLGDMELDGSMRTRIQHGDM